MRVPSSIFPSIYITQVDNHEYLEFTKVSSHCECQYIKLDSFQSINTYWAGSFSSKQCISICLSTDANNHLHTDSAAI